MSTLSLDADRIKRRCADPIVLAQAFGLDDGARRQRSGLMIRCPWHVERTPSCSLTIGPDRTLRAHCFGCAQGGDVFSLAAAALELDIRNDFARILREVARRCGLDGHDLPISPPRPAPRHRQPSPLAEVATFWAQCRPVVEEPALARALLELRELDPAVIADRDLARALPPSGPLPGWARYAGRSWRDSAHGLLVPLFDATGEIHSVHARSLRPDAEPKGLSPAGHSSAGLILADHFARLLLADGIPAWWHHVERPTIIVAEGVPDYLTIAGHYGLWEYAPATIGVISGAWSQDIADRIPDGCRVVIRTHSDEAGMKYRRAIAESLCNRCRVEVRRYEGR